MSAEASAVLAKSQSLIEKTWNRLKQIDQHSFPTPHSQKGLLLCERVLEALRSPDALSPVEPNTLYRALLKLQRLIDDVGSSSTARIVWPFVSCCDDIWTALFGSDGPKIFYSLTHEHTYDIYCFSDQLESCLADVLPKQQIKELINETVWCLRLASLEDDNLPLYANIAHEFGHALHKKDKEQFERIWYESFGTLYGDILLQLGEHSSTHTNRRVAKLNVVLERMASELYADMVASLLMGPAYFLSLQEMSWGSAKNIWLIRLQPDVKKIKAYPSFECRLEAIWNCLEIGNIPKNDAPHLKQLPTELRNLPIILENLRNNNEIHGETENHKSDTDLVDTKPESDSDCKIIAQLVQKNVVGLNVACASFSEGCVQHLRNTYTNAFSDMNWGQVSELILRLYHDIPPNIIPDGSLLGVPADFHHILTSAALYRMYLLCSKQFQNTAEARNILRKIERLTAKSLEVSFIQREYNENAFRWSS